MAARRRYLLTYDIREDRRLRRVHRVAKEFGYALQYSVFVCDLDSMERVSMLDALLTEIHSGLDSVALFDLGDSTGRGVDCVEVLGVGRKVPPSGGPAVW